MRFINPKTDYAFKKIFGSEESHDILISFLNAMLYDGNDIIKAIEILNPYAPRIRGIKDTFLAVKATNNDNTSAIVKMQILNSEGFEKGLLYNAAHSKQIETDNEFIDLEPAIALTITEFEMFPDSNQLISRFMLQDKIYLSDYPIYDIELVFVELPKFDKPLAELETLTDKWLYFLKTANQLEIVPPVMEAVPEIQKAFAIANRANLSQEEIDELEPFW
jgi:predicted transposase/invertase (TIGR01784 family)